MSSRPAKFGSIAVLVVLCLLAGNPKGTRLQAVTTDPNTIQILGDSHAPPFGAPASALADSLLTHAEGVDNNDEGFDEVVVTGKHIGRAESKTAPRAHIRSRRHRRAVANSSTVAAPP
jgi:hypothetical protein